MVPEGWERTTVGDTLVRLSRPVAVEGDAKYRQIGIRSHGKGIFDKEAVTGTELRGKRVFWIEPDCFIVNIVFAWEQAVSRTTDAEVGKIASHRFPMFRPRAKRCDVRFIEYYFKTPRGKYLLGIASPGGAGRNKTLGQKEFERIPLTLPPLPEQRKIADILSTWDQAIEKTEALLSNARTQKRALMQQLLTGKRRFPAFEGQPWKEVRLGDVATIDAKSLGSKTPDDFEFSYISLSNVVPGRVVGPLDRHAYGEAPSRARRIVQRGDLLVSTVRPNLMGFARVTQTHSDCIASTGFAVVTPKKAAIGSYLYHYLFSHHMKSQVHALVVGSNYPAINSSDVKKLKINLPPLGEQKLIGEALDNCDVQCDHLTDNLSKLRTEKKALMQQLLTGKRRVVIDA
ncbi:restriction endonuclease subunit S [Lentibacter algarum]|uniref:restriction endonuclease subunit S n=1 Tax=Lentibacter algarum TaxID=576131 RepID=UPI002304B683|nr:restriction endonuclease subunit S [Lentibacter algarum]